MTILGDGGTTGGSKADGNEMAKQKGKSSSGAYGSTVTQNPSSSGTGSGSVAMAVAMGENIAAAQTGVIVEEWDPILMAILSGEGF